MYRHGGGFYPFVGARIVKGIMRFVAYGMMVTPNSPGNVEGRGHVGALHEVFLSTSQQPSKRQRVYWSFVQGLEMA
jgi:hypothetical protein